MKRLIPSMFHRRLVLIGAAHVVAVVGLGIQLGNLTLVRGAELRERAEARLRYAEWLPTSRGRILDRKGRVLAQDRACYHVAVDYPVISGTWARERAVEYAHARNRSGWRRLSAAQREALAAPYLPAFQRHVDAAWGRLALEAGIEPDELAQERETVVESIEGMADHLREQWVREFERQHAATGREMGADDVRRLERQRTQEIAEQRAPQVVIRAVADEIAFGLLRLADQEVALDPAGTGDSGDLVRVPLLPGLVVEDGSTREYPFESVVVEVDQRRLPLPLRADGSRSIAAVGVLSDVLGWMGTPTKEVIGVREALRAGDAEFVARTTAVGLDGEVDLGAYRPGDLAGVRGVEASQEARLRGLRGQRQVRRDTGDETLIAPEAGRDVHLTVDAMLQARVQAAMSPALGLARVQAWHGNHALASGTPLVGAAVVLDVDTGEVLAMVSTPGGTVEQRRHDRAGEFVYNRAVGTAYAPGSVAKVVVLLEAVRAGAYRLSERIACTGHLLANDPNRLRCWIYKRFQTTHSAALGHDLSASEALTASCNIFFYTLARRLGVEGIEAAYRRWGVGRGYDFGVGPAARGAVAPEELGQAILMGIGQGPVSWTPMHAADALATIARGGVHLEPRIVADGGPSEPEDMGLDPAAIEAVIAGLDGAVHDATNGTGHHITFTVGADGGAVEDGAAGSGTREVREEIFNIPGVRIVGKTGTASARLVPLLGEDGRPVLDDDGNAENVFLDHSWYVALVGPESGVGAGRLKYAIAVMMENAGSGGKVSGPICNQIVGALVDEGYLPRVEARVEVRHASRAGAGGGPP